MLNLVVLEVIKKLYIKNYSLLHTDYFLISISLSSSRITFFLLVLSMTELYICGWVPFSKINEASVLVADSILDMMIIMISSSNWWKIPQSTYSSAFSLNHTTSGVSGSAVNKCITYMRCESNHKYN